MNKLEESDKRVLVGAMVPNAYFLNKKDIIMSLILIKNMAEQFNSRYGRDKQVRLKDKLANMNNPELAKKKLSSYREHHLLNIESKSGFWGRIEKFFAECCDRVFNTHIIASQQEAIYEEIKEVSGELFSNLPDHSKLSLNTRKTLYENPEQGYSIIQEGFKVVAYSGVEKSKSASKKEKNIFTNKMELIDLSDENKYNKLMDDLKNVYDDEEWKFYIKSQIEKLIPFKNISVEFARDNSAKFIEESGIEINHLNEDNIQPEELEALARFNLRNNYNSNSTELINKFNSTLIREIFNYCEGNEQDDLSESDQGIIASEILNAIDRISDNPIDQVVSKHINRAEFLESAFRRARQGIYSVLEEAHNQKQHQELSKVIISVVDNLPSLVQLQANTTKVLYTNEEEGYRLVQEGRSIFLYSGIPFSALNQRLKSEIKALSLASNNDYNNLKDNLHISKRLDYLQGIACDGHNGTLFANFETIVYDFANQYGLEFNDSFTVENARKLGISLNQDLTIDTVNTGNSRDLEHLMIFFLLYNEATFKKLEVLRVADINVYEQLNRLDGLSEDEANLLQTLHLVMPQLEALKKEQPELFYLDTTTELLKFFDENESLKTYGIQNPKDVVSFAQAVRDNGYGFTKLEIVDSNIPGDYVVPQVYNEKINDIKESKLSRDNLSKNIGNISILNKILESKITVEAGNKARLIYDFDPMRLQERKAEDGFNQEQHYITRLKAFYGLIGFVDNEIPRNPLGEVGNLNPILGKKIKEYLAIHRSDFFESGRKKGNPKIKAFFDNVNSSPKLESVESLKAEVVPIASPTMHSPYVAELEEEIVVSAIKDVGDEIGLEKLNIKELFFRIFMEENKLEEVESVNKLITKLTQGLVDLHEERHTIIVDKSARDVELAKRIEGLKAQHSKEKQFLLSKYAEANDADVGSIWEEIEDFDLNCTLEISTLEKQFADEVQDRGNLIDKKISEIEEKLKALVEEKIQLKCGQEIADLPGDEAEKLLGLQSYLTKREEKLERYINTLQTIINLEPENEVKDNSNIGIALSRLRLAQHEKEMLIVFLRNIEKAEMDLLAEEGKGKEKVLG
jgi:hypothetical protein